MTDRASGRRRKRGAQARAREQRRTNRRIIVDDRRQHDRRVADRRRNERRNAERRGIWCAVCRTQLTPQGYCQTCRVRVITLRP